MSENPESDAPLTGTARVGIIMGSTSDWPTMEHAAKILAELDVPHECRVVSAHRTPDRLYEYARSARDRGLAVIIAGAGGAAHLPGMTAAMTTLPVLGVPIESQSLKGQDSLLSIVQMPGGHSGWHLGDWQARRHQCRITGRANSFDHGYRAGRTAGRLAAAAIRGGS